MENSRIVVKPHSQFLELLFAFKSNVSNVFKDVLGLHGIHHLALTRITASDELITFSSSPALEYNLFSSSLWRYDNTYSPPWFQLYTEAYWHDLYKAPRFDELHYLKQIKHAYPIGLSLAARIKHRPIIYSLASHKGYAQSQEEWMDQRENFHKIGQYCANLLDPLFQDCTS